MKTKYSLVRIRASRRFYIPSILAAAVAFALSTKQAEAQTTILWNTTPVNNVANGDWGNTANWAGANIPDTNTEIASLSRDWTGTGPTFALGADRTINGLIYEDTGLTGDLVGSIVAGSTLTFSGTTPTITTPNSFTINSIVNWGATGLTKAGNFTLTLTGNNTGTGAINLTAGIIRATTSANALGTGTASLSLSGATTVLQLANDTALNFARNTTVSAATTITADRLTSAATSTTHTLGTLTIGAQTLSITRGSNITTTGIGGITFGSVTQTGAAIFDVGASATLTLGALQTTGQNITKQGTGTIVLGTAANALRVAGSNTLTAGTMRLGSVSALGTAGATLVLNGGTLDLATDTTVNAHNTTVGGATTISSNKATASSAGITHTLGTLSISAQTLNVTRGGNATSGTGAITFGATTLTGAANFAPAASAQLTLGAVSGGANSLTKSGAGTLVLGSANIYNGGTNVDAGVITVSNASALGNGTVNWTSGDTGRIAFAGGITYANNFVVGSGVSGTASQGLFGHTGGGGVATISGTVLLSGLTGAGGAIMGSGTAGQELRFTGAINQTASNIGLSQRDGRVIYAGGGNVTGNFVVTGTALLGATNGIPQGLVPQLGGSAAATLNLNGFDQTVPGLLFGFAGQVHSGTVTLGANTLTVNGGVTVTAGTTPTHTVNGTGSLNLGSTQRDFSIADTTSAVDLTINAPITGSGGFAKTGAGALSINSTVEGPVAVSAGSLMGTGTLSSGVSLATGSALAAGTISTVGTLTTATLALAGTTTLQANLGANGTDLINVTNSGGLTQSGTTNIVVSANGGIDTSSTFYPLISYVGTSPGLSGFTLGTLPGRATGTLTDTGSQIGVTAINDRIIWTGTTDGNWDVNTTANWKKTSDSSATNFLSQDDVLFNDDGIAQNTIALTGTIDPVRVQFAHTTGTYTIASGTLSGSGLMKFAVTGGGTVVLRNTNSYTGPTTIDVGTLELDHDGGTMTATSVVNVESTGSLRLTDDDGDFTFNRVLSGTGGILINPNTDSAIATAVARGATLSGTSPLYTGTITLESPAKTGSSSRLSASPAALGSASIVVQNENQFYATSNASYSNNITITGDGYNDGLGSIGAIRMDGGVTWNGTTTVTGTAGNSAGTAYDARIGSNGGTNTMAGSISGGDVNFWVYNTTQAFIRLTAANSYGDTIIGGAENTAASGVNSVTIGNAEAVPTNTTATLGTGDVYLVAGNNAAPRQAILRINRADGYTLGTGQDILGVATASAQLVNGAQLFIDTTGAGFTVGANTIDLADGTSGGQIRVAQLSNNSVMNIGTGSTIDTGFMRVGEASGLGGTINQTAGSVNALIDIRVGHFGSATSTYNFSGGTIALPTTPASEPSAGGEVSGALYVGVDGTGIFNQTNGTLNVAGIVLDNRGDTAGNDQFNLSGGTVELRNSYGIVGRNTSATVALNGGTVKNVGTGVDVAINATTITTSGSTTLDTNGATNKFSLMSSITGSGTLTTSGDGVIELEPDINTTKTSVSTGTGTQSISAILAGTSAVTKLGTGTTILSAANTYSGATTVSAGNLGITGSLANSDVSVATAATISGEGSVKSLSFGSGSTNLRIDGSTPGALTSTGTLTVGGTVTVDFTVPPPSTGSVVVLTHGGTTASASNFALANPANFRGATFAVTSTEVTLDVNKKALVWDGTTATWEIAGSDNDWNDTANDNFFTGDAVTFDETYITGAQTVTMTGALAPSGIIVNNSTHKYTLTGSGISGATGLTKSGTAALDLGGTNTFTGAIAINGGVVTPTTATAFGSASSVSVAAGARVDLNGQLLGNTTNTTWTIAGDGGDGAGNLGAITNSSATAIFEDSSVLNLSLSGDAEIGGNAGRFDVGRNGSLAISNGVINGAGFTLTKVGSNQTVIRGTSSNITFVVNAGTLWFEDNDSASGTNPITVNSTALMGTYGVRTISNNVTLNAGSSLVNVGGGTSTWSGAITLGGNAAINNQNASQINVTGTISGNSLLSSLGGNTNVLTADNSTFTGKHLVETGILRVSQDLALGAVPDAPLADAITLRSGGRIQAGGLAAGNNLTLHSNRGITLPSGDGGFHVWSGFAINYAGAVTGAGNLTKTDGGILNYTGTASHTGATSINGGTANLSGATISSTSTVQVGTATLNIGDGAAITTGTFVTSQGSSTISTINQSGGNVTVTGTDNSNSNLASVLLGHWGTGAQSAYNMSGGTFAASGAQMNFGWDASSTNFNQTGGTVNVLGVNFGNTRNNAAAYNLNGGRLNLGANGITNNTNKVFSAGGGTLGAFANWTTSQPIALNGFNGPLTVNNTDSVDNATARNITMSGILSGAGGLIKTGAGKLTLSAANTFTGNTIVNEGILELTGGGGQFGTIRGAVTVNTGSILRLSTTDATGWDGTTRLATINLVGGSMDVNTGTGLNQTLGNATINMTGASITGIADSNLDFFAGSSALNSLASSVTSTVSGTRLKIRQTGGVTISTATGTAASGVDLNISSVIAQDAGFPTAPLKKAGAGTLQLSGANTFTANTEVNAGRLLLTGSLAGTATVGTTGTLAGNGTITGATTVATTGVLSPGNNDVSTLNFGSTLALESGSSYAVTITGATTNDKVIATGAMTANGNIVVTLSGYTPVAGDSFDIADASSITGTPTFTLPTLSGLVWDTSSFTTDGKIKLVNLYSAWASATGATGGTTGDPDSDGLQNLLEYAFGTNPTANYSGPLSYTGATLTTPGQPILEKVGGVWYAVFARRKDYVEAGLTYTVEFSNSLSAWTPSSAGLTVIASDSLMDVVRVPFPNIIDGGDNGPQKPRFFQVEVTSPF
jgi:autotransporter-associated beta strand protein